MAKLVAQLVAWNGAKYIPYLFASLRAQTVQDWDLIVIDNGSTDGTIAAIERALEDLSQFRTKLRKEFRCQFVRNAENRGFAGGHNQGFLYALGAHPHSHFAEASRDESLPTLDGRLRAIQRGGGEKEEVGMRHHAPEYIQLLNQDTVLAPEYFERLVGFMERTPTCAAAQGALLRWDFSRAGEPGGGRTDTVDTLGLRVLRSRRVVELGTGEQYEFQISNFKFPIEVFGVSGALPMYRMAALMDVALPSAAAQQRSSAAALQGPAAVPPCCPAAQAEVFDEDFFSYKEDVDLAFRLRSAGWAAYVVPNTRAWHDRTAAGPRELSDAAAVDLRRSKSPLVRYHSYKNQLLTLVKNEHPNNFARHWPWVVGYELRKLAYVLLRERDTLRALREVWQRLPAMRAKRRAIMAKWQVDPMELRRWYA